MSRDPSMLPEHDSPAGDPRWEAVARALDVEPDGTPAPDGMTDAGTAALIAALRARPELPDARFGDAGAVDVEAALARVRGRIAADAAPPVIVDAPSAPASAGASTAPRLTVVRGAAAPARAGRRSPWVARSLAAAAVVAVAAGLAEWRARREAARPLLDGATRAYVTDVGVRDSLRLPDGTRIVLAPGSRLEVPGRYGAGERAVTLAGSAHFTVTHDARRPFVVRTAAAEIRDLGTAFVVREDDRGGVAVLVTEGMVALRPAASRAGAPGRGSRVAELQAGDRGTVAPEGGVTVTRGAVTGDDASWTTGALQFREAPVREVLAELARWYGVPMRLGDERLAARTLTATFAPGDSAAAVLRTVALALGAELSQQGDTAVLRAAGR